MKNICQPYVCSLPDCESADVYCLFGGLFQLHGRTVGFQGEKGAYSEQAAIEYYGADVETVPLRTVSDVFLEVESGGVDSGIVPVENSIGGNIYETYDMLSETSLNIAGETILRIEHCLIGARGSKLPDIKTVYSHPQALEQCRNYLKKLKVEMVSTYDTAGSVRMIKEGNMRDCAAIAAERNASLYGLEVIAKGIEGYAGSFTRFLIMSKDRGERIGPYKTSLMFGVDHSPGSLYRALEPFAELGINLSKIESRPKKGFPWEYYFFMDFEGGTDETECALAVSRLRGLTQYVKVLGSYRRAMPPKK